MSTLSEWATRARSQRPNLVPARERTPLAEGLVLGLFTILTSILVGLHLSVGLHILVGDAISRVDNAYYVLFSRDPHLGAIGFVWNPLPSLLEMPLTLLRNLWPPIVTLGFAGNIVSALFAGVGAVYMDRLLFRMGLARAARIALTALYVLNPLILFYSANGMSDVMMVSTFLATWEGVLAYHQEHHLGALVAAALWLAAAFLIRYEALPFAGLLTLGLAFALYRQQRSAAEIEGALTILLTPIVYVTAFWVYLNWLIMKNPLYFAISAYSNSAQIAANLSTSPLLLSMYHHGLAVLAYITKYTLVFWPIIPSSLLVLLLLLARKADERAPLILLPMLAVPGLQAVMLYMGRSAAVERYFITFVPEAFILFAYLLAKARARRGKLFLIAVASILLLGDVGTGLAIKSPDFGYGDAPFIDALVTNRSMASDMAQYQAIASYADRHPKQEFLLDTFALGSVVIAAAHPHQFVMSSDLDFKSILHYPEGRVTGFLVPEPTGIASLDAINRIYPTLWSGRIPWAHLVREFPGSLHVRLFRVLPGAPGTP